MKGKTRIRTWAPKPLVRCSIKLTGIKFKSQCQIAQSIEYLAGDSGCSGPSLCILSTYNRLKIDGIISNLQNYGNSAKIKINMVL